MYKLKSERVKRGIKQGDFAKKIGITPQHLCRIEKGEVELKRSLMIKIAEELNSDVITLFFSDN